MNKLAQYKKMVLFILYGANTVCLSQIRSKFNGFASLYALFLISQHWNADYFWLSLPCCLTYLM